MIPKSRKRVAEGFEKEWIIAREFRTPVLMRRIKLIEACSQLSLSSIPSICHSWNQDHLVQKMPLLEQRQPVEVSSEKMHSLLMKLALDIECIHEKGLIHGDIHPKNILYTGVELKLVDFEPILELESNGVQYYCSTRPWVAHEDLKNKKLSVLTDRIGFAHTAMRLLNIKIPKFNTVTTYRERRKCDHPIGGLITDEWVKGSYCPDILKFIYEKHLKRSEQTM